MATISIEHITRDRLIKKGMGLDNAGILGFDLANSTGFIEAAESTLAHAIERRAELIREARAAGLSYRSIAQAVGLSHQRIAQILDGQDA